MYTNGRIFDTHEQIYYKTRLLVCDCYIDCIIHERWLGICDGLSIFLVCCG